MDELITLIKTVDFPVAACCVMFYQNSQLQKTLSELSTTLRLISERLRDVETKIGLTEKGE